MTTGRYLAHARMLLLVVPFVCESCKLTGRLIFEMYRGLTFLPTPQTATVNDTSCMQILATYKTNSIIYPMNLPVH